MQGQMDILEILLSSGVVVKIVLILLLLASVLSWAIIFLKKRTLSKVESSDEKFYKNFQENYDLDIINSTVKDYQDSSMATMFHKGYLEYTKLKNALEKSDSSQTLQEYMNSGGMEALERSLKQGANSANQILEKRLSNLASIGSITPFIGLLGTVWGIINSFTGLASGGGSIEAVAPGIAEALVATAVGLFAAIPAVWLYNIFTTRIATINSNMDSFAQDFLNTVQRNILTKGK